MILSSDEMNAIKGLVHYLNENFDGHGLAARVELVQDRSEYQWPEASKGEITVVERDTSIEDDTPMLTYAWGTGDD